MPRRVVRRKWHGLPDDQAALEPEVLEFLIDGNYKRAGAALHARGLHAIQLWQHAEMARVWVSYRATILREAKRRGVESPWGCIYDRYNRREQRFSPLPRGADVEPYEPEPDDSRLRFLAEEQDEDQPA